MTCEGARLQVGVLVQDAGRGEQQLLVRGGSVDHRRWRGQPWRRCAEGACIGAAVVSRGSGAIFRDGVRVKVQGQSGHSRVQAGVGAGSSLVS